MKRHAQLLIVFLAIALALTGCGRRRAAPTPTSPPPTATQPAPTATPQPQQQPTTAPTIPAPTATTAPLTSGEAEEVEVSQWTGLETLNSYRSRYIVNMEGVQDGTNITRTIQALLELNRQQNASHSITTFGSSKPPEDASSAEYNYIETIVIGENRWMKTATSPWGPLGSGQEQKLDELAPAVHNLIQDAKQLRRLGRETVNGVSATHYQFGLDALSAETKEDMGQVDTFEGHLWIATDNPFIVKLQIAATGPALDIGSDAPLSGRLDLLYEAYDINRPITIEQPEVGPPTLPGFAEGELPLPEDAKVETAGFGVLVYLTSETIANLATMHRERLTALGWTEQEGGLSTDTFVSMDFTKENVSLSLSISADENGKNRVAIFATTSQDSGQ